MPTYLYKCPECGCQIDHICRIKDRPEAIPCPRHCLGMMTQVITAPTLKLSDAVNVPWIRRAMNYLEPEHANKYDTREKYQGYLKEKGLRPTDGINLSEV